MTAAGTDEMKGNPEDRPRNGIETVAAALLAVSYRLQRVALGDLMRLTDGMQSTRPVCGVREECVSEVKWIATERTVRLRIDCEETNSKDALGETLAAEFESRTRRRNKQDVSGDLGNLLLTEESIAI